MKKKTALFLATLLIAAGVGLAGDNPVVGTWEVVSSSQTATDGTSSDTEFEPGRGIKIYSKTHFTVIGKTADGKFTHANAGSYEVKGSNITEMNQISSTPDWAGKKNSIEFSISGDLLTGSYVSPLTGAKVKEVWKRVK